MGREPEGLGVSAPALFLSAAELRELTGRARKVKQAEWLRANNIPFFLNAMQRPVVTRAAIVHNNEAPVFPKAEKWNPAVLNWNENTKRRRGSAETAG